MRRRGGNCQLLQVACRKLGGVAAIQDWGFRKAKLFRTSTSVMKSTPPPEVIKVLNPLARR